MKIRHTLYIMMAAALTACSNGDILSGDGDYSTLPDEVKEEMQNAKLISFTASATESRAAVKPGDAPAGYRWWDTEKDFKTMGVFGWYNLDASSDESTSNKMFYNTENSYGQSNAAWANSTTKWTYATPLYWADYNYFNSFDFFAVMPHIANSTFAAEATANTYTISVPLSLYDTDGTTPLPVTKSETAYISKAKHLSTPGYAAGETAIPFQFDQTMTGYKLAFKLGTKMGAIRQFRIKNVTMDLSTEGLAYKGTATRTYTWNATKKTWTESDIAWTVTDADRTSADTKGAKTVAIPGAPTAAEIAADPTKALVTSAGETAWGEFYAIPDVKSKALTFTPTLSVTYDVEVVAEDGKTWVTRKDVTSTIKINKDNFPSYTSANVKAGYVQKLLVNIVPDYLYVLSDYDHNNGVLLVSTK